MIIYAPDHKRKLAELCANDWPRLMYDGLGIMVSDSQAEVYAAIGQPGPRSAREAKFNWVSGGQRAGKTVLAAGQHIDACFYKRGVDYSDATYWRNYQYRTLAIAPTTELTLRLWSIIDEISKGSHNAQYDRKTRRSRGGAFIGKFKAGKADQWPIVRFSNGSEINFRSSEGFAYRLEGGQWWWITWDEWASQPDREIEFIRTDVLMGRSRDYDAKIEMLAWPKPETEHHLIKILREIESGRDRDSRVFYLDASEQPWTNKRALEVEIRRKTAAQILRTIKGRPAGGAGIEFKSWMLDNMFRPELSWPVGREDGYDYFTGWDIGLAYDDTVGLTFRIPVINGRRIVSPEHKARLVNAVHLPGGPTLTPDTIAYSIAREQHYYAGQTAIDATSMGGIAAFRQLRSLNPQPYSFSSRSNDRIHGNMRLAAITNGLDCLTWGRPDFDVISENPEEEPPQVDTPWGLFEVPASLTQLRDQMASFDRNDRGAKAKADDWVWAFLIAAWYIRRWWAVGEPGNRSARSFDISAESQVVTSMLRSRRRRRSIMIAAPQNQAVDEGIRYIRLK